MSKVYFPRILVPIAGIAVFLVDLVIALGIYALILLYYGIMPGWTVIFVPLLVALTFIATMSLGLMLSALMVFYRDFRFVVPFLSQILLFMTPVVYPLSLFRNHPIYRSVLSLNPMFGIVPAFRSAILGEGGTSVAWRSPRRPRCCPARSPFSTSAGRSINSWISCNSRSVIPAQAGSPWLEINDSGPDHTKTADFPVTRTMWPLRAWRILTAPSHLIISQLRRRITFRRFGGSDDGSVRCGMHRELIGRRHCSDAKQRGSITMLMTGLSGNEIYCLAQKGYGPGNIVVGNSVHSLGFVRGITSGLKTLSGGEIRSITQLIVDGRHAAINRLEQEAKDEGDRGLTGVASDLRKLSSLMEFIAIGSSVKSAGRIGPVLLDGLHRTGPVSARSTRATSRGIS